MTILHTTADYMRRLGKRGLPFETVAAMLLVGSKYHITHLRADAVDRLTTYFSDELGDFDAADAKCSDNCTLDPIWRFPNGTIHSFPGRAVLAVIDLAQNCDVPGLLPSALYFAAQMPLEDIFGAFEDADGHLWSVSADTIKSCVSGQVRLRGSLSKALDFIRSTRPSDECQTKDASNKFGTCAITGRGLGI